MKKILTILFICVGLNAFSQELDPITTTNLRVIINRINTLQGLIGSGGGKLPCLLRISTSGMEKLQGVRQKSIF